VLDIRPVHKLAISQVSISVSPGDSSHRASHQLRTFAVGQPTLAQDLPRGELQRQANQRTHSHGRGRTRSYQLRIRFGRCLERRIGVLSHQVIKLHEEPPIAMNIALYRCVLSVPPIKACKGLLQSNQGATPRTDGRNVGRRVTGEEGALTGAQKVAWLGKVVVDRKPLNARAAGDVSDCRPGRPDLPVKIDGCPDDPITSLLLTIGACLELVLLSIG